ncbi:MAG: protein kinase [Pirellulales bacterium]
MSTNPSDSTEDLDGESPDESQLDGFRAEESRTQETHVDGPSIEEVIERLERVRPADFSAANRTVHDLAGYEIGHYTVRRIVGRGAFGVVYQAHDNQLGRDVALKVPRSEVLFDEEKLQRFEKEAATAATLEHPSIIPIFEAELTGPTPYIASAYCIGPDLGEWLTNLGTKIPVEQVAHFVIKLAEAVHYAHKQGVLHRDLKPSNIMLEPCHTLGVMSNQLKHFEPRLTDFGLAKLLDSDWQDTRSSMMLGTPRYMAPEQFDKRLGNTGVPSDVYALGAILYELLIGQPAIEGSSHGELLLAILDREVTPPSRIRSNVTPTLEAICLKALEKRPRMRYATANELAEDLGRYLRGEPTQAKPLALPGRVIKWIGLNPLAACFLTFIWVSIVSLVLGVLWHNRQLNKQLAISNQLRIESVENASRLLRARYVADMQLTQQALSNGRFSEARSRLDQYQPGSNSAKVKDFVWHLLSDQLQRTLVEFDTRGSLTALATSESLQVSATGDKDGRLRFFNTTDGVQLAMTQAHVGNVNAIVFAEDGTTAVSGGDDGKIYVWNISSLCRNGEIELLASCQAHQGDLLCLAIAPDSKRIASGGSDNRLFLWNLEGLESAGELKGHTDWIRALDFSPDGRSLVSASDDETIRRWNIESKKEIDQLLGHEKYVLCVKHHPTEPMLVSGGKDRSIRFWDLVSGEELQQLNIFNGWIRSLSFSADGNQLVVAAEDPRVMLLQRVQRGHYESTKVLFTERTGNLAASLMDSKGQIVSAGNEGASTWFANCDLGGKELHYTRGRPFSMASHSNKSTVTLVTSFSAVNIDFESDEVRNIRLSEDGHYGMAVAISSGGNLIAVCEVPFVEDPVDQCIFVTDEKCENKRVLFSGDWDNGEIAVSPSGRFVAAGTPDRQIRVWQAPNFNQETIVHCPFDCNFDSFMIDDHGKQLFLQSHNSNELMRLDVATSKPVAMLQKVEKVLNRSADNRLLAISRSDYSVTIYDTHIGWVVGELSGHTNNVIGACFSPTEPLVATITNEGEIALWALDTREMLVHFQAAFQRNISQGACLAFTSDGRALVAAGCVFDESLLRYSELRVWRVP